jgi:hypothetical protein
MKHFLITSERGVWVMCCRMCYPDKDKTVNQALSCIYSIAFDLDRTTDVYWRKCGEGS